MMHIRAALMSSLIIGSSILLSGAAHADTVLYDNGPITTGYNGYNFTGGYTVADSFALTAGSTLTRVDLGVVTVTGQALTGIDWSILTASPENGGTVLASGTAAVTGSVQYTLPTPVLTFDISEDSFSLPSTALGAGTYWLQLQAAQITGLGAASWYETDGASLAYQGPASLGVGEVGSESFQVIGAASPPVAPMPEPSSWALMLAGVGGVGAVLRRKMGGVRSGNAFTA